MAGYIWSQAPHTQRSTASVGDGCYSFCSGGAGVPLFSSRRLAASVLSGGGRAISGHRLLIFDRAGAPARSEPARGNSQCWTGRVFKVCCFVGRRADGEPGSRFHPRRPQFKRPVDADSAPPLIAPAARFLKWMKRDSGSYLETSLLNGHILKRNRLRLRLGLPE